METMTISKRRGVYWFSNDGEVDGYFSSDNEYFKTREGAEEHEREISGKIITA